jgi:uroporphyrinogen decarboxylase
MTSALLRVLAGERIDPPPVWLMRQAGRYLPEYRALRAQARGFLDFCFRPDLASEATLQPLRRFDLDAAILFSDILVVPHGLGAKVWFVEGEGPRLEPIGDAPALRRLSAAGIGERLAPVYEAAARVRAQLDPKKALIGFAGGPWTVACYMVEGAGSRDFAAAKSLMWRDGALFDELITLLTEATIEHVDAQIAAGVDCIQLFDSWSGVLPEREFERYVIEPTAKIRAALRLRGRATPLIGFPRGAGQHAARYARQAGLEAVSLDSTVGARSLAEIDQTTAVQGLLDPILLLVGGERMRAAIGAQIGLLRERRHVFNLGHGVLPQTPPDHVADLVAAVKGWRGG